MNRGVVLEGVENFRDYGGYTGAEGQRLKTGKLYRSAGHSQATEADLEAIAALDIAVIVDLRRPDERRRDPARRPSGFAGEVIDNDQETTDDWRAHIASGDLSEAGFRRYMVDYYRKAAFEPRHVDLFSRYFRSLAQIDGAILIHCTAGKDRTGILAALTHHLAGVRRDDIVHDYLLTNDPDRLARRLPTVVKIIEELAGQTPNEDAVRVAMGVEALYLDTAFAAIEERYGGVDAYLAKGLGVDASLRSRLEARLFE
jgi:protein-tyrosine phosphatase